jgi:hypothetical protein
MRSSFRLLVVLSVPSWPVPAVPPVRESTQGRWRPLEEAAAVASPTVRPRHEVVECCPVPSVPAVPSARTRLRLSGTWGWAAAPCYREGGSMGMSWISIAEQLRAIGVTVPGTPSLSREVIEPNEPVIAQYLDHHDAFTTPPRS